MAVLAATVIGSKIMASDLAGENGVIGLLTGAIPTGAILMVLILELVRTTEINGQTSIRLSGHPKWTTK